MILEISDEYFNEEEKKNTPDRFNRFMTEWLVDSNDFEFTTFKNEKEYNEMIVVRDINFYSLCSHHIVPFFGVAHIGYIPDKKICGLSKIPRTVDKFAHRPQIQEKLTIEIKDFLVKHLNPIWLMIILEGEHLCMSMRGVKKPGHMTITSSIHPDPKISKGKFDSAKSEFLTIIKK